MWTNLFISFVYLRCLLTNKKSFKQYWKKLKIVPRILVAKLFQDEFYLKFFPNAYLFSINFNSFSALIIFTTHHKETLSLSLWKAK